MRFAWQGGMGTVRFSRTGIALGLGLLALLAALLALTDFRGHEFRSVLLATMLCLGLLAVAVLLLRSEERASALLQAGRRLNSIFEAVGVGTWEWNAASGETHYGAGWARMVGYSLEELPPDGVAFWRALLHPDDRALNDTELQRHLDGETTMFEVEIRVRHRLGHWIWVRSCGRLSTQEPGGGPGWVIGADLDITERRRMERDLVQSEAMLERAGAIAGVGGWQLDLQSGQLSWSPQAARIHGREPGHRPQFEESLADYVAEDRPVITDALARIVNEGSKQEVEVRLRTPHGGRRWVHIVGEPAPGHVPGTPVRHLIGCIRDITERRALEEAEQRSHRLLHQVVDQLPLMLMAYDADQRLIIHNAMFQRQYELPESLFAQGPPRLDDVLNHLTSRGSLAGRPAAAAAFRQRMSGFASGRRAGEVEYRRSNGTIIQVYATPLPDGGAIYLGLDVTARRRSEYLLRNAMDAIDEAFVLFDPDDRLVLCNDRYRSLFPGQEAALQPGTPFIEVMRAKIAADPSHEAHGHEAQWLAQRQALHAAGDTKQVQRAPGERWVRVIEKKLPDGHIAGFRIDITDLMHARQEAERASLAKSQFLANMSHEIRTPMNAVLGMLRLLQRTALSERQRDYVVKTESAARSLLGLLNDILDFSKVEAGKLSLDPQPMRIDALLRDLSVILAANVGQRDIEVLFDVDPRLPRGVVADALRLQQVLINLAGNAIKFTEAGEVVVQLKLVELSAYAVTLDFAVKDTGIGIAPEHQQQIFSGFAQAEASTVRRYGGTGLGLAISRRLVRLMGSELKLESQPGRGSRFYFRLRLALPDQQPATQDRPQGMPLRVLVVDDNPVARELLSAMCQSLGWVADTADSGAVALELCSSAIAAGNDYQIAIVDWSMPEMDGWTTCRAIRALSFGRQSPVLVMVSAHGRDVLSQRSQREQELLDAFLVKPVTASMLLDAVADARAAGPQTHFDLMHEALSGVDAEHERSLPAPGAGSEPQRLPRLAGLRLLLVEDNPNNQQVARELLEDEGALVQVAGDGQQALHLLGRSSGAGGGAPALDAVLMDLQMPVMDGYTATRQIRSGLGLALPVIAMTANARASDRQACIEAGMNEHVGKPFDIDHLVGVLRQLCGLGPAEADAAPGHRRPAWPLSAHLLALADAAGIALAEALARLSGKRELFVATVAALVDAASALTDPPQAMALHAMRGLAGTLGCNELAGLAAQGQRALESGAPLPAAWRQRFEATLGRQLIALGELAAALPMDERRSAAPAKLGADLSLLAELLEGSDMAALDLFARLREGLQQQAPQLERRLAETLASLDFESAARQCRELLTE
ncbi:response regulator [Pelomonas sp. KK5]|uniref:response regulator n=1 Tax=Pelomonas sp. KK5 TaxID=1855730 RepID=UPI0009FB39ED|nr:response regulator [Pelomonas sp. KK5]